MDRSEQKAGSSVEVSVVMPCLNEAETLASCIRTAQEAIARHGLDGEVVVADNGSTDGSQEIAAKLGARLVDVSDRGYGAALMGGIAAARGEFVVMGDADESYDFAEVPAMVAKLREGFELVQGCRLPTGGGTVLPGAMPFLHRSWGNPMFSRLTRWWFKAPIHDVYCGLRGFTKTLYERLDQRCIGMEFAVEMILKASLARARIAEVPITLHPDGRKAHAPHLKTFRDGWRTLRFFLISSPRWLFLMPGIVLVALGLAGYAIALPGLRLWGLTFGAHTLVFASLALICGFQAIVFSIMAKTFAVVEGLHALTRLGFHHVEGVDLSSSLALRYAGPARIHVADCRRLPFVDSSKDIVVVQGGLHHLQELPADLRQTLAEAHRVLRDGGLFLTVEPWSTPFLRFVHLLCPVCSAPSARNLTPWRR